MYKNYLYNFANINTPFSSPPTCTSIVDGALKEVDWSSTVVKEAEARQQSAPPDMDIKASVVAAIVTTCWCLEHPSSCSEEFYSKWWKHIFLCDESLSGDRVISQLYLINSPIILLMLQQICKVTHLESPSNLHTAMMRRTAFVCTNYVSVSLRGWICFWSVPPAKQQKF